MLEGREPKQGAIVSQVWESPTNNGARALGSKIKRNGKFWKIIARAGDIASNKNHYVLERAN